PVVGQTCPTCPTQGQNLGNLAAVLFAPPETLLDTVKCLYEFLLILIVLYIVGTVLKNVLYKDIPANSRKRFLTKWFAINLGIIVAIIVAYALGYWCLILPLIIALIIGLVWMSLHPEHEAMKASVKSWYLVGFARGKSIIKGREKVPNNVIIIGPKK
ncbi:MAG: hypothetical protein WD897_01915, partial [Parcubacteria group bacterium]